jgi:osmotically-inducible protein OsmY
MRQLANQPIGIDECEPAIRPVRVHVGDTHSEMDAGQAAHGNGAQCPAADPRTNVKEPKDMSVMIPVSSRVVQALRQSSTPALRRLGVEEDETTVVITGRVGSYYLKQLAQETVMVFRGDRRVENRVSVERE